jgi:hypothetical protein
MSHGLILCSMCITYLVMIQHKERVMRAHILVDTSCNLCFQCLSPSFESDAQELILLQLSAPYTVGLMYSSIHTIILYMLSIYFLIGSTYLLSSLASNGAVTFNLGGSHASILIQHKERVMQEYLLVDTFCNLCC